MHLDHPFAGLRKCREQWPVGSLGYERAYNLFLAVALLVLPLMALSFAYLFITRTLYVSMRNERAMNFGSSGPDVGLTTTTGTGTGTGNNNSCHNTMMRRSYGNPNQMLRMHLRQPSDNMTAIESAAQLNMQHQQFPAPQYYYGEWQP